MTSPLHAVTDGNGRPISFFVTAGQISDNTGAAALLDDLPSAVNVTSPVWQYSGRDKLADSEIARIDRKNRRTGRKMADFDGRQDVRDAAARLAAVSGVVAEVDAAKDPDAALFEALAPVVADSGRIVKIYLEPAFDLLRVRAAKVAAGMPDDEGPLTSVPSSYV